MLNWRRSQIVPFLMSERTNGSSAEFNAKDFPLFPFRLLLLLLVLLLLLLIFRPVCLKRLFSAIASSFIRHHQQHSLPLRISASRLCMRMSRWINNKAPHGTTGCCFCFALLASAAAFRVAFQVKIPLGNETTRKSSRWGKQRNRQDATRKANKSA